MASRWLAVDKPLFATSVAMISFGLLMVYSASFYDLQQAGGNGTELLLHPAHVASWQFFDSKRVDSRVWFVLFGVLDFVLRRRTCVSLAR